MITIVSYRLLTILHPCDILSNYYDGNSREFGQLTSWFIFGEKSCFHACFIHWISCDLTKSHDEFIVKSVWMTNYVTW